ncbi:hypothetical protein EVAR_7023_1 [Eumeta japonica]|uniref:Uncharacterized protein n=1 Tax=Eumeta variegata TaxID=151549 RepID=A0A4C1TK69_EUMVA|nr:hypothetical protein EVAR_7023_1 [Eumeta japonica]
MLTLDRGSARVYMKLTPLALILTDRAVDRDLDPCPTLDSDEIVPVVPTFLFFGELLARPMGARAVADSASTSFDLDRFSYISPSNASARVQLEGYSFLGFPESGQPYLEFDRGTTYGPLY